MTGKPKLGLSREFVLKSILQILEQAEERKEWGSVQVSLNPNRPESHHDRGLSEKSGRPLFNGGK